MKTLRLLGAAALCAVMIPALTSCGDDDNDEPGGDGTGGVLVMDGLRVTSINSYKLTYDDKGRVTTIYDNYGNEVAINYSKGTIQANNDSPEDQYKVKFNGKGYISQLSSSWDYKDTHDNCQYKGSGTVSFTYNGSGNITKVSASMSETEKDLDDNSTEKYTEKYTTTLTWSGGKMTKAETNGTETEGRYSEKYSESYTVSYGTTPNEYRQLPIAISQIINDDTEWDVLASAGLFGRGPEVLPSNLAEVDDDGYTSSAALSYYIGSNGAIQTERVGYSSYTYTYGAADRGIEAAAEVAPFNPLRSLFKMRHRSRK